MKIKAGLSALAASLFLSVAGTAATADTYLYELEAEIDFSAVDPDMLDRANLGPVEVISMRMELTDPRFPVTPWSTQGFVPDVVEFEVAGQSASGRGATLGNGGQLGRMSIGDQPPGATYNDFLGFNIEPRALQGLPFGKLAKLFIKTRYDNTTFDSLKLPGEPGFMQNLITTNTLYNSRPHVELFVYRKGLGSGFDWAVAPITDIEINVSLN